MPDRTGRSPALGFSYGIALAAGAVFVSWLAYLQLERARRVAGSTFEVVRWDLFAPQQVLLVASGVLFGMVIVVAFRGPSRSRRATLLGGVIPPALLLAVFWAWLYSGAWLPRRAWMFVGDGATQAAAAVAVGILLMLTVVPVVSNNER